MLREAATTIQIQSDDAEAERERQEHRAMSPIHYLPVELLGKILAHGHEQVKLIPRALARYLACIVAVCKHWNWAASSHAALWTTMYYSWDPDVFEAKQLQLMIDGPKHFRRRLAGPASRGQLDITLQLQTAAGAVQWPTFAETLAEHSARCRSLSLTFNTQSEARKALQELWAHPFTSLQQLDIMVLELHARESFNRILLPFPEPNGRAWHPHSIGVFGFSFISFSAIALDRLTEVKFDLLRESDVSRLMSLLCSAPHIRHLDITIPDVRDAGSNLRLSSPLYLPSLHTLTLCGKGYLNLPTPQPSPDFVVDEDGQESIELPKLCHLTIRGISHPNPPLIQDVVSHFDSLSTLEVQHLGAVSHPIFALAPVTKRWPTMHLREDVVELDLVPLKQLRTLRIRDGLPYETSAPTFLGALDAMMDLHPELKVELDGTSFRAAGSVLQVFKSIDVSKRIEVVEFGGDS